MIDIEVTINDCEQWVTYSAALPEDPARLIFPPNASQTKGEIITDQQAEINRLRSEIETWRDRRNGFLNQRSEISGKLLDAESSEARLRTELEALKSTLTDQEKKIESLLGVEKWWARRSKSQDEKIFQLEQIQIRKDNALQDAIDSETRLREELNALVWVVQRQNDEILTLTGLNQWWQQHSADQNTQIDRLQKSKVSQDELFEIWKKGLIAIIQDSNVNQSKEAPCSTG